jgi:DNA-binding IclR family transcriptional regulator
LEKTRKRGYSVSDQEWREEIVGVGAALVNGSGRPVAAISFLLPVARSSPQKIEELGALVGTAAASIELRDLD